jgi:hypothetical protein
MLMRPVVIEMRDGKPVVVSCPRKVQVIIREPKKKTFKKRIKTMVYQMKSFMGIQ